MDKSYQTLFIILLSIVGVLIITPSVILLLRSIQYTDYENVVSLPDLPIRPDSSGFPIYNTKDNAKTIEEKNTAYSKLMDFKIKRYEIEVKAYESRIDAIKKGVDAKTRFDLVNIYQTVIKESLVPLVTGVVAAIAAFVLVQKAGSALKSFIKNC